MQTKTQKQQVELFFNAGDYDNSEKFIIYPKSLKRDRFRRTEDYEELLETVLKPFDEEWELNGYKRTQQVEHILNQYHVYPNPTSFKLVSKWFYGQILKGAIIFRYGYDGRKEKYSHRSQYTMEGAYLEGIDLKKSVRKYDEKGIDIIDRIGNALPVNIEELLIQQKREIFEALKEEYTREKKLNELFNRFYRNCKREELAIDKVIETYPLYQMSGDINLNCARKRVMKEMGLY